MWRCKHADSSAIWYYTILTTVSTTEFTQNTISKERVFLLPLQITAHPTVLIRSPLLATVNITDWLGILFSLFTFRFIFAVLNTLLNWNVKMETFKCHITVLHALPAARLFNSQWLQNNSQNTPSDNDTSEVMSRGYQMTVTVSMQKNYGYDFGSKRLRSHHSSLEDQVHHGCEGQPNENSATSRLYKNQLRVLKRSLADSKGYAQFQKGLRMYNEREFHWQERWHSYRKWFFVNVFCSYNVLSTSSSPLWLVCNSTGNNSSDCPYRHIERNAI